MSGDRPSQGGSAPDVVGFGALNVDYIAGASRLSERADEKRYGIHGPFRVESRGAGQRADHHHGDP